MMGFMEQLYGSPIFQSGQGSAGILGMYGLGGALLGGLF